MRDEPNGEIVDGLYEGEKVELYYLRQVEDGLEWALIRNAEGQLGWVVTRYLQLP